MPVFKGEEIPLEVPRWPCLKGFLFKWYQNVSVAVAIFMILRISFSSVEIDEFAQILIVPQYSPFSFFECGGLQ